MSQRLKILNIVGARPNLPKIAPLMHEMQRHPEIEAILVHTGQHYDEKLSDVFFRQMGIPSPHVNLEVGSGSHASQTAEILKRIEPVLLERKPDLVLVVGDVNSTIAVSLASVKLGIRVAHVEAGLRSFDRTMPEEINRVLTDAIAAFAREMPVIFPVHPRTQQRLNEGGIGHHPQLRLVPPVGYLDFLCLMSKSTLVLTDSGGIQEETTALGVPCLTLRENTERPITISEGTNLLVGTDPAKIVAAARDTLAGKGKPGRIPPLWDGHAAKRIVEILLRVVPRLKAS